MSGTRIDLPDPRGFDTPREYIENHLAPVANELQRLVNEFIAPGSTSSEEWAIDMSPAREGVGYMAIDTPVFPLSKSVLFDGREYFAIPKETLRNKRLKVQLNATVYVKNGGSASFRLIRGDGSILPSSEFTATSSEPVLVTRELPFGEGDGCVIPHRQAYVMQAKRLDKHALPVCRRFSLSFLYI